MEYLQARQSEPAAAGEVESLGVNSMSPVEPAGTWVNDSNGQTRLALSRDGRYNKTQGLRQSTHSGHYSCQGTRIRFVDDFDFVLTGEIRGNTLRVGKYIYHRA
jgi:hypothetical protein